MRIETTNRLAASANRKLPLGGQRTQACYVKAVSFDCIGMSKSPPMNFSCIRQLRCLLLRSYVRQMPEALAPAMPLVAA